MTAVSSTGERIGTRRAALKLMLAGALAAGAIGGGFTAMPAAAQANAAVAQQIADHFSRVRTMTGSFIQIDSRGDQTEGTFYLQRPGKIRFDYQKPSSFKVTSDGTSVVIENTKMRTADLYPLSTTPLKMLLDSRIDLSGNKVRNVTQEPDLTTIQLADKSMFGNSVLTLMFDPKNFELKQWTIRDAQGKDTTVMIYDVKAGVGIDPSVFAINYTRVREMNNVGTSR